MLSSFDRHLEEILFGLFPVGYRIWQDFPTFEGTSIDKKQENMMKA